MKHLRLAAWTVWFMACFVGVASAEPISMLIAGIAGILKAGGIGAMLIKAAFGIALQVGASLLQKAMAKRQPQPGITGQLQVGGNNSVSFLVGDYATAGSLEYTGEWGYSGKTPNAYHVQVVTLSDLPQPGIGARIWINGQKCEIDFEATPVAQGYPVKEYRKGGNDHMWVKVLDGSQTETDPYLLDKFGSHPEKPWKSDMIGRGATVVILTALINRELLTQLPAGRYEPVALPLYDPRKDTTVGGDGDHRWGVPATYEPTANPVVIIYNLMRGIWYEGDLLYGPAIPATRLPLASWFAAMNECDIPVEIDDDLTEPQFRCGYEIKIAETQPIDVIQELLKSCNGRMIEVGGVYKIHVGAPALPVAYITDDDFMVTEEQEFEPFPGLENTFNGATANYPEPETGWEMKDAPQRLFPEFEAEDDGRRLLADFQFNAVSHAMQVQRLMKSMVEDGRRFRKHRGTLGPWAFMAEPMDTISWTSAREGYDGKLFCLDSMDDLVNANQAVAFRETDPADFDWNFSTDGLPWSVGPIVPTWPTPQPVTGWQVLPAEIKDASGAGRRPSIEVRFDGDLDDVRAVRVLVRLAASGEIVFDADLPYGAPDYEAGYKSIVLNGVFLPAEGYEVQGQFVPFSARDTVPSAWLPVTTLDIRLSGGDIYADLEAFGQDAYDTLLRIRKEMDAVRADLRLLAEGADEVAGRVATGNAVAVRWRDAVAVAMSSLSAEIAVKARIYRQPDEPEGDDFAEGDIWFDTDDDNFMRVWSEADEEWQDATSLGVTTYAQDTPPTGALPGDIWIDTTDGANVLHRFDGNDWVEISDERIEATASALTAVQAAVGDISGDGLWKMEVVAGSGDVTVRAVIMMRATIGDDWVEVGTIWEAGFVDADPAKPFARQVNIANQFVFTDGVNNYYPIVIDDGVLKAGFADLGHFYAGIGEAADGSFRIDFAQGKLEWFDD